MNRRNFIAAGGALATASVLGSAGTAFAHGGHKHGYVSEEDPDPNVLIASVDSHQADGSLAVTRVDGTGKYVVSATSSTEIPMSSGKTRRLTQIQLGEKIVIVAPGAGTAVPGSTVQAQRVVHCNFGKYSDLKR